jgi:Concanavalin A-like lectin/glucanases superfamily
LSPFTLRVFRVDPGAVLKVREPGKSFVSMKTDGYHCIGVLILKRIGPWLPIFLFVTVWGMAFTMMGCSPSSGDNGYHGISDRLSTGSSNISNDRLVMAFDMETLTPDDRLYDFSSHQHHSHVMETTLVPGLFGDARQFRTPGDRIDLPETPALDIDGPLSIALWFRVDTPGLHQHIIAVDDKFVVWINQANRIRFTDTRGNGLETQAGIEAGQWYGLAALFDGSLGTQLSRENIHLYLDGEPIPSNIVGQLRDEAPTWQPGQLFSSDAAYIGFESHQGEPRHQELPFQGVIDEVLVFSRALSLKEILAHADRDE